MTANFFDVSNTSTELAVMPEPFTARYGGWCSLATCEKRHGTEYGRIEPGDCVIYREDELMHLSCARRAERGETEPLCKQCYCYHQGECQ